MQNLKLRIAAWGATLWWRLSQAWHLRFSPTARVQLAKSLLEIAARVSSNDDYRPDRRAGNMTHARVFEARRLAGKPQGDCEDFAAYWAVNLYAMPHVAKVWLGSVGFDGGGHAVVLFENHEGELFWADYGMPMATSWDVWDLTVYSTYEAKKLRGAFAVRLTVDAHDTVKFGEVRTFPAK